MIDATGTIVFKGHPSSISEAMIERELEKVVLPPKLEGLPDELSRAAREAAGGDFGGALKELGRHADDADVGEAARKAIAEIEAYGEAKLALVDTFAASGRYAEGLQLLDEIEREFKRHEIGDQADDKAKQWKRDKRIKAEIEGQALLAKADELIGAKRYRDAARYLVAITRKRKFDGTKCRELAEQKLKEIEGQL